MLMKYLYIGGKMKVFNKIFLVIVDFLMLVVIVIAFGVTLFSLNLDKNGVSSFGKYIPLSIQSDSMRDTIYKGDFIIVEEHNIDYLKVGDIIAFFTTEQEQVVIKTHRIVKIYEKNGSKSFVTRGDNNQVDDYIPVYPSDIIGKWEGIRIACFGSVLDFISSQYGFLLCIILPLFALFIYQIYRFIIILIEENNSISKENGIKRINKTDNNSDNIKVKNNKFNSKDS